MIFALLLISFSGNFLFYFILEVWEQIVLKDFFSFFWRGKGRGLRCEFLLPYSGRILKFKLVYHSFKQEFVCLFSRLGICKILALKFEIKNIFYLGSVFFDLFCLFECENLNSFFCRIYDCKHTMWKVVYAKVKIFSECKC